MLEEEGREGFTYMAEYMNATEELGEYARGYGKGGRETKKVSGCFAEKMLSQIYNITSTIARKK